MFEPARIKTHQPPRPVTIELRDGRKLRGHLRLAANVTPEALLSRRSPFLVIRTRKGDLAINRDMIAAILLGSETDEEPKRKPGQGNTEAKDRDASKTAAPDPCRVLRVRPGASESELRDAWRRRIRECHPDIMRSRGHGEDVIRAAQREAQAVNAAYQKLRGLRGAA